MKLQRGVQRQHRQLKSPKTGEEYSLSSVISESFGAGEIFLSHEVIMPGRRSSAPHFHLATDEIIYVLKGHLTAIEGDMAVAVGEGDSVLFERGSGQLHFLKNDSAVEARVLVIRKMTPKPDVLFTSD